jgi:hypothetical protein
MALNMKKLPLLFLSDSNTSGAISREVKAGRVRKIGPRLYTTNISDDPAYIIRQNWLQALSLLLPGCVVSNRTALESRVSPAGRVYVTGEYPRSLELHGTKFIQIKGPPPVEGDTPLLGIFMSSRARALLENLTPSRERSGGELKNLSRELIERRLAEQLNIEKEKSINRLRDQARLIAPQLGLEKEFAELDDIIGTLLRTRKATLADPIAKAHQLGAPYDPHALAHVEALWSVLASNPHKYCPTNSGSGPSFYTVAFFDAYFSNYIEGTRFQVDEAKEIVDSGVIPAVRPADGHDILGTYRVVSSLENMRRTPGTAEELIELLRARHTDIMVGRPDKRPGQFKEETNFAGATRFVDPDLVQGTLMQGFGMYKSLEHPFARALLIMFLVAEVHPFDDGNGRTARAMMNSELVAADETRIIIPSVFRNEYVASLKRLTNHLQPESFISVMSFAREFVFKVSFEDYSAARLQMEECHAFDDPADDKKLLIPNNLST